MTTAVKFGGDRSSKPANKSEKQGNLEGRPLTYLNKRLKEIEANPLYQLKKDYEERGPHYKNQFPSSTRVKATLIVALIIVGLVVLSLFLSNHLMTFPQDFLKLFQHVNVTHLAVGGGIFAVLLIGVSIVIYRAITKKEGLLEDKKFEVTLGKGFKTKRKIRVPRSQMPKENLDPSKGDVVKIFSTNEIGHDHLEIILGEEFDTIETFTVNSSREIPQTNHDGSKGEILTVLNIKEKEVGFEAPKRGNFGFMEKSIETVLVRLPEVWEEGASADFYVDTSTLDENKNGKAYLYRVKDRVDHYYVSTIVTLFGTALYVVGSVVYNLIRAVVVPFYILVQYFRELCTGKALFPEERRFELLDAPKECLKSIWRAIKAPFYALAFICAGLYSFVNPMGGRKLGASLERDWNEEVSLAQGYWSKRGKQHLFRFEGGGGPLGLGRNGFYLAGCWQPVGVVEFENGKIKSAYWLPKAVNGKGHDYQIQFVKDIESKYADKRNEIINLNEEHTAIQKELKKRTAITK